MIVEAIMITSLEIIILMFVIVLELFPGNSYKNYKYNFQLGLSVSAFILGLVAYIIAAIIPNYVLEVNRLLSPDTLKGFVALYTIFLVGSVYRYYDIKKSNEKFLTIQLKKEEYTFSADFNLLLGDSLVYMPNISKCAVTKDKTIIFTSVAPEEEIDANFLCKPIGENTYECVSIDKMDNHNSRSVISYVSALIIAFIAVIDSFLLIIGFHNFDNSETNTVILNIFGELGLVFIGGVAIKLFKNVEGITKYIFIIFGCFMIIIGIANLLIMFL